MRNILFIGIALVVSMVGACQRSSNKQLNQTPSLNTLRIEFETKSSFGGMEITAHETQWIDQKNNRKAIRTQSETKGYGVNQKEEQLTIEEGDWVYTIDLISKTGTKMKIGQFKEIAQAMGQFVKPDFKNLEEFVKQNGGTIFPNETFLGKDCKVFEVFGMKQWLYKDQVLKVEMNGQVMRQATQIEEDANIPDDVFKIPEGIHIEETVMENEEISE